LAERCAWKRLIPVFGLENNELVTPKDADHEVRAVQGVGWQPLNYWRSGFESRCGHGYSSLVFVLCCAIRHSDQVCACVCGVYLWVVCVCVCVVYVCVRACVGACVRACVQWRVI
jgi:hypothetical protein